MSDAAVRVTGLSHAYAAGTPVLADLTFTIPAGMSVGIVGPHGAGKTTLFLCLAGVRPVRPGSVLVAGLDPSDAAQRRQLPASLGLVFQNSDDQLFNATVFDDVAFGPLNLGLAPDAVRQRVAEALQRVGLTGYERRVPYHLSGGEKRRAALAGVLAMRPAVLLLDEPSVFLDPRGRRELVRLLNGLDVTKLIASHDLEFILETCERVLLLDGGRLAADGPAREVLADPILMERHGLEVPHSLRFARQNGPDR